MNELTISVHAATVKRKLLCIPQEFVNIEPIWYENIRCIAKNMLAVLDSSNVRVMGFTAIRARKTERAADILTELIEKLEQTRINVLRGFYSAIAVALFRTVAHELLVRKIF